MRQSTEKNPEKPFNSVQVVRRLAAAEGYLEIGLPTYALSELSLVGDPGPFEPIVQLFRGIKCHSVGGRQVTVSDPAKDIRGPNLELASERLKPDWLLLWLFRPSWITPYTSMPSPLPPQQAGGQPRYPELFDGEGLRQTVSLRDSLVNYYKLLEREVGTVDAQKSASRVDAGKGQQ